MLFFFMELENKVVNILIVFLNDNLIIAFFKFFNEKLVERRFIVGWRVVEIFYLF